MYRRKNLLIVVLLLAAGVAHAAPEPASRPASKPASAYRTFTNKKHKVRFKVPATMDFEQLDVKLIIAQYRTKPRAEGEEPPLEILNLLVIDNGKASRPQDLPTVIDEMRKKLETTGGKVIRSRPATLGGAAAHELAYSKQNEIVGRQMDTAHVVCIRDGKTYVLGFVAEAGKLDEFMRRVNVAQESFEWLE